MSRPIIAITMGDAAGVGPEIIMKSLAHAELYSRCAPLVIGDAGRLRQAGEIVGTTLQVRSLDRAANAEFQPGTVDCIDLRLIPDDLPWGKLSPVAGDAAYHYIKAATELAVAGEVDAICTAPLNKEALHAGGHKYPGHTEMLAELTGTPEVSMMLTTPNLRSTPSRRSNQAWWSGSSPAATPCWRRPACPGGRSAFAPLTRMPASTACSAEAKRRRRSSPLSRPVRPRAGTSKGLSPPTRCFSVPDVAISTWSSPCITTRATAR